MNLLGAVAKGKDYRESISFLGYDDPLVIAPLTVEEADLAFSNALSSCRDRNILDLIVKVRLKLANYDTEVDLSKVDVGEYQKFMNTIDYWLAYYGTRDCQPPEFQEIDPKTGNPNGLEALKKFHYVHEVATRITEISGVRTEKVEDIEYIVRNAEGKLLADCHWKFHIGLADKAWQLTPLQMEFLNQTNPNAPRRYKSWEEVDDSSDTYGSYMDNATLLKKATRGFLGGPPPMKFMVENGKLRETANAI